ncbi:hypothetical protein [Massilia antarctica]|uniref:hypothetical protein n=1 Tax=Massilia antarctica TaxID=2765360 RepID=UPI00226DFB82|nr:hypothetical protein [Massilia sp. H27-R4]MCY0910886.1 hypothetical protein [Massilia sp. H27-R4]
MKEISEVPTLREISADDVVRFLNERGASPACTVCGHGYSSIHIRDNESVSVLANPSVTISNGKGTIDLTRPSITVATECDNCGHYRFFSYVKILNWADKNRGPHE